MNDDLLSLKLYVDNKGEVWYIDGNGPPTASHKSVVRFLLHPMSHEMPRTRLIGLPQNIQLLLALHARAASTGYGLVEMCGPMACKTAAARNDPYAALYAMRTYEQGGSTGGWHSVKADDCVHLALAHRVNTSDQIDDTTRQLYRRHPAWLPLNFIPHLDQDACIKLLATIVDPRWFINPTNPARGSRLRQFLSLDLKSNNDRRTNTIVAWSRPYNKKLIEKPDHFLWRIHRDVHERTNGLAYATMRATQTFVEYLRLCWLAALGRGRHQNEALFVPEYFFKESYEAKAFNDYFRKAVGQ